jgi:uncharacterized damage-inducible protein DinB
MDRGSHTSMLLAEAVHSEFQRCCTDKLDHYVSRIESCLGRLTDAQVWTRGSEQENAIGNIVLHLCGNVRQWITAGVGDAPDARDRDAEFDARGGVPIPELIAKLRGTVDEAIRVIQLVPPERLLVRLQIQKYDVTVMQAIFHVVEHFSGHTGQIIFMTKMLTHEDLGFYKHLRGGSGLDPSGRRV